MEYATIHISGSRAAATEVVPITAGTVGGRVALSFDKAWEGFQKTLVWQGSGRTIDDLSCTGMIPAEVLTRPYSPLVLGVYGTKEAQVLPTVWVELGQIQPGADPSGDESADPTLPVWAQLKQEMVRIDDQRIGNHAWSSNHIVDKLCPNIFESGPVVACQPLAGYPLTVQADHATKVYRCGKNLIKADPRTQTVNGVTFTVREDGSVVVNGTVTEGASFATFTVCPDVPVRAGATYSLSGCTGGSSRTYQLYIENGGIINIYNANTNSTQTASGSGLVGVRIAVYSGVTVSNLVIKPQLEIGSAATAHELHRETEEFAPGETIPALEGVNTIWADSGEVTVTGKADPVAVIEKLTQAIG